MDNSQELKLLTEIIDKSKVKYHEIFSHIDFDKENSKITKLFNLLKSNEIHNLQHLKSLLLKQGYKQYALKKIVTRYQEKLINTLFFIDTNSPQFNERAKAYYNCARRAHVMRILIEKGLRGLAISIAEKTLSISLKYEFTEISLAFLRLLLRQYSTTIINKKKLLKYKSLYAEKLLLLQKEFSLELMVSEINYFENSIARKFKSIDFKTLAQQSEECIGLIFSNPSIEILISSSRIILFNFQLIKDFKSYKEYCLIILDKLLKKPFISVVTLEGLVVSQLKICFLKKDKETALELKEKYFNRLNIGNFNWYVSEFYFILTMFHCNSFFEAGTTLEEIFLEKNFKNQPPIIKENFYVLNAYMNLITAWNSLNLSKYENKSFLIKKFLNQVPDYSRDKQGLNIPIILVQILFFLADKKYTKIIDRIESLNLYAYRHLKKDENFRSQCFIRMISEMVRADFKKQGTTFRTEKLLNKLKAVPIDTYPASAETEIIPYEDLWAMVVERLEG